MQTTSETTEGDDARALSLLRRWQAEKPFARKDPNSLGALEVTRRGPRQLTLTSVYESRGVKYKLKPAERRPAVQDEGPDPWAVPLNHPDGLPVGSEARKHLPNGRVHMDCGLCSGSGEMTCRSCGGDGQGARQSGDRGSSRCYGCGGSGQVRCSQCKGSGGLFGTPTVWSRIDQHEEIRVEAALELPLSVLSDLMDGDDGGDLEHVQEGPVIQSLQRTGGYRDAGQTEDALSRLAANLCQHPNLPPGAKIHRQRLEVRRVPVFEVRVGSAPRFCVYGEPPRVRPRRSLETVSAKLLRASPWLAGGVLVCGAIAAAWLMR
ncbi:MAG: hypothetical protein AB8I08_04835 [Sandaracinaceae bacterium]